MKIVKITKDTEHLTFGDLDAGDVFMEDPYDTSVHNLCIKLNEEMATVEFNAIFIEDGTSWNFDDGEEVILVKSVTLED